MQDLKLPKPVRPKGNRRKKENTSRDWNGILRRCLRVSIMAGGVALGGSAVVLGVRTSLDAGYFKVATIRVENQKRLSEEEVLALSNIRKGMSVFDLDLDMIGRKIEENAWIAKTRVERIFPDEVIIRVTEREPLAILCMEYLYYVDEDGIIFKVLEEGDKLDFPVLTGLERSYVLENPKEAKSCLKRGVDLLKDIKGRRSFNIDDISEVHIDPSEGYQLVTYRGGIPIYLGDDDFGEKLDRLEKIYKEIEPRLVALRHIDLNVADRVIVRVDTGNDQGKG